MSHRRRTGRGMLHRRGRCLRYACSEDCGDPTVEEVDEEEEEEEEVPEPPRVPAIDEEQGRASPGAVCAWGAVA